MRVLGSLTGGQDHRSAERTELFLFFQSSFSAACCFACIAVDLSQVPYSDVPHSDLEVVPKAEALDAQKYAYYAPEQNPNPNTDTHKIAYNTHNDVQENILRQSICGMRRKVFWIIVILAIIVVVGAVGGGVGGALASKSSGSNNTNNSGNAAGATQPPRDSSSPATTPTPTPTPTSAQSSTSVTTTSIVGPSSTILRDCPSSNGTLYDITLGDTKMTFRKACETSFLNANGIDNVVGKPVKSLNECIDSCAAFNISNRTQIAAGTNKLCNAVCWRNTFDKTNDWTGGMCFGFTTQNSSSTFRYRMPAETICDSAALINQAF
jgi:hypothetical protein